MENEIIICTVNFADMDVLDEALSCNLKRKAGECAIKIKGNEGIIPHFHIESKSSKFHTTVKIYEADYSGIHDSDDELSTEQKKILNNVITDLVWYEFREQWNSLNVNTKSQIEAFNGYMTSIGIKDISKATKPDYTMIP